MNKSNVENSPQSKKRLEISGIFAGLGSLLLLLALISFQKSGNTNLIGPVGAYIADTLYFTFGIVSYFTVVIGFIGTIAIFRGKTIFNRFSEIFGYALCAASLGSLIQLFEPAINNTNYEISGLVGSFTSEILSGLFGIVGAITISITMIVVSMMFVFNQSILELIATLWQKIASFHSSRKSIRNFDHLDDAFFDDQEINENEETLEDEIEIKPSFLSQFRRQPKFELEFNDDPVEKKNQIKEKNQNEESLSERSIDAKNNVDDENENNEKKSEKNQSIFDFDDDGWGALAAMDENSPITLNAETNETTKNFPINETSHSIPQTQTQTPVIHFRARSLTVKNTKNANSTHNLEEKSNKHNISHLWQEDSLENEQEDLIQISDTDIVDIRNSTKIAINISSL